MNHFKNIQIVFLGFIMSSHLYGQVQPNDNLCNASQLVVGALCSNAFNGDNTNATIQFNEPIPACFVGVVSSVWFKFVAPPSGIVNISTNNGLLGTNRDTEIALYSLPGGNCNDLSGLSLKGCSQDINVPTQNYLSELLDVVVTPGQTYYIQVSGWGNTQGTFCVEVTTSVIPVNDDLCDAIFLYVGAGCTSSNGDNSGATTQPNEPNPPCFVGGPISVWYKFTAPPSGIVNISTDNNVPNPDNRDTEIALYALPGGNCSDLSGLVYQGCSQDVNSSNRRSRLSNVFVTPGQDYYIQVSGGNLSEIPFCINVTTFNVLTNDDLCDAETLVVDRDCEFFTGDNTGSTSQPNEPNPSCFAGGVNSVWFTFVGPPGGNVNITTNSSPVGTNDDTEIAIYTLPGGNCNNLSDLNMIECDQDINVSGRNYLSELINIAVDPGENYYIQVSGWNGKEGAFCLEVYQPDTTILFVDHDATGTNDGSSWANAFTDLQMALASTGIRQDHYQIWVAGGTYYPTSGTDRSISFELEDAIDLYGGFDGTEMLLSDRIMDSLVLHVANKTTLSGNIGDPTLITDNSYHVVSAKNRFDAGNNNVLDGFTVTAGNANGTSDESNGGGMFLRWGAYTLNNCILYNNTASIEGGGIYCYQPPKLVLNNCLFLDNNAYYGGGIRSVSANQEITPVVNQCIFKDNTGSFQGGGANISGGFPFLFDCHFIQNRSSLGGGVYFSGISSQITDCKFIENITTSGTTSGGGMYSESCSHKMKGCSFQRNNGGSEGGGMSSLASQLQMDSCLFVDNYAFTGGGMYNEGSDLVMEASLFDKNSSNSSGAGMKNLGSTTSIHNCIFQNNITSGLYGGGLSYSGFVDSDVSGCTFTGNVATNGGGIAALYASEIRIKDCFFSKNRATSNGGGAYSGFGNLSTISFCTFDGNRSNNGGGFYSSTSFPTIAFCTFVNDTADFRGGGMGIGSGSFPTVQNCTFRENLAGFVGGGVSIRGSGASISNTTLSGNFSFSPTGGGGGMSGETLNGELLVSGCTFTKNQTQGNGSGFLQLGGTSYLRNSIIADNPGGDIHYTPLDNLGAIVSKGHNLIGDTTNSLIDFQVTDLFGSSNDPLDPELDVLGDYGGPTLTYAPLSGSPVLGTGEFTDSTMLLVDQRGFSRIKGNRKSQINIGAYEGQSVFVTPSSKSLCVGDTDWSTLGAFRIQDSTGGAFHFGTGLSLSLSLPDGIQFQPGVGSVECEGAGLSGCSILVAEDSLTIFYDRIYDTVLNTIRISGLNLKVLPGFIPGEVPLLRTSGNGVQSGNGVEDSVAHARISVVPTIKLLGNPYDNSFESDSTSWVLSGSTSIWEWGTPAGGVIDKAASGKKSWMTGLDKIYSPDDTSWIASPCFDFTGVSNPLLATSKWVDTEEGFDGVALQQSVDEGVSWQTVGTDLEGLDWYNASTLVANPGNQSSQNTYGWTGRDTSWRRARLKLNNVEDEVAVRFRMAFASISDVDTSKSNNGFAFDDFYIGESNKKILLEHFTDQEHNDDIAVINSYHSDNKKDLIPIQFHMSEGDVFYDESPSGPRTRGLFYGVSETGFAAVEGVGFLGVIDDLSQRILETNILSESGMEIGFDTTTNGISIKSLRDYDDEIIVYVAVVENTADYKHVFRKFLPNPGGTSFFGWEKEATETLSLIWNSDATPSPTIIDNYDSLHVIVWAQNQETKEVYQTTISPIWTGLLDPSILRKGQFAAIDARLAIYPNPVRNQLFLSFGKEAESDFEVLLTDMQGRAVLSRNMNAGEAVYAFDLSQLSSGVYALQVKAGGELLLRERIVVMGE